MRRLIFKFVPLLLLVCPLRAQRDLQSLVVRLAPTASDAVYPIAVWYKQADPNTGMKRTNMVIVGTAFMVDRHGDFITAGHVMDALDKVKKTPNVSDATISLTVRQRNRGAGGALFTIIERDDDHDLVLCHTEGVNAVPQALSRMNHIPQSAHEDVHAIFASLAVSTATPRVGTFVIVSGFPLGSWTPTVQLGLIAAAETVYPDGASGVTIHKDNRDLLQISVDGNHGNSGGPVIDVNTGKVVGVIDQIVPAPIAFSGQLVRNEGTFAASGIMLAAPAKWVAALLEKNHIKNEAVPAGKLVGF